MGLQQTVDALEERWGLTAFVHGMALDGDADVGVRADEPVVAASVFKLPVLVEACRQIAAGDIDPTRRFDLAPDDFAVLGPTGIAVFADPVSLSFRDLCLSMMSVSDNRATDVVMDAVGLERVNATMRALGLGSTVLEGDCAALFASITEDLAVAPDAALDLSAIDEDALRGLRALDPRRTNRTTPREASQLLARLWTDRGIDPSACAEARRILGLQVWSNRLRAGFPDDSVRVSGKTGTLLTVRNEVGVVEHPDGGRCAVSVFLRLPAADAVVPHFDHAIGEIAAAAVAELRAR
ncbi:beta-lactamase class A [Microcella alkaliphila]|uniref:Beta-lactamase class A n=1 Tax=Microcella alkaliphila TaxID=279828 RepID=A0A4Q7TZ77_9MICO|nr:serine hydrolase [Microcella alkaliphila]RZT66454.1 beta-lactamase class A [Microcella alkaliphila]